MEGRFEKCLNSGKGKLLSIGGRLVLVNSVLSNMVLSKNLILLGKWLFRVLTEDGVWQTLLKRKYIGSKVMSQVYWKSGDTLLGWSNGDK